MRASRRGSVGRGEEREIRKKKVEKRKRERRKKYGGGEGRMVQ